MKLFSWFRACKIDIPVYKDFIRKGEFEYICNMLVTLSNECELMRHYKVLAQRIVVLWDCSGTTWLSAYLKEVQRLLHQNLAGEPDTEYPDPAVAVSRDKFGLPRIIPSPLRLKFNEGNPNTVRCILSIVGLYRSIMADPVLKTQTIESGPSASRLVFTSEELSSVRRYFPKTFNWSSAESLMSNSAGPNHSKATKGMAYDAIAFWKYPLVWGYFALLCVITGSYRALYRQMFMAGPLAPLTLFFKRQHRTNKTRKLVLGRLSLKLEAAGKVRVFAITDWWSQCLLYPLHSSIFSFLKRTKTDGTFDQTAPFKSLLKAIEECRFPAYSFDLSAATDRLPIQLQEQILASFVGKLKAACWRGLLTGRPWYLKDHALFYGTGQPMGAYSSWAMLALTHHYVVQVAAWKCGWKKFYPFYAILGDDVVILRKDVAEEYYTLMTSFGVEINRSKSIVSEKGLMEFAKRLISPRGEYTPLGSSVVLQAYRNPYCMTGLVTDALRKSWPLSLAAVERALYCTLPLRRNLAKPSKERMHYRALASCWAALGEFGRSRPLVEQVLSRPDQLIDTTQPLNLTTQLRELCWSIMINAEPEVRRLVRRAHDTLNEFKSTWQVPPKEMLVGSSVLARWFYTVWLTYSWYPAVSYHVAYGYMNAATGEDTISALSDNPEVRRVAELWNRLGSALVSGSEINLTTEELHTVMAWISSAPGSQAKPWWSSDKDSKAKLLQSANRIHKVLRTFEDRLAKVPSYPLVRYGSPGWQSSVALVLIVSDSSLDEGSGSLPGDEFLTTRPSLLA